MKNDLINWLKAIVNDCYEIVGVRFYPSSAYAVHVNVIRKNSYLIFS